MLYVALPDNTQHRLPFYLAMEEYVAKTIDEEDCFFMWQVQPSVIFGRNQLVEAEVNLDYCREHSVQTYRRKSGGGCVYADMSNIMFSYVTKDEHVNFTFNKYINMVVMVLQKLGLDAKATGRNDVLIGDRKVSGNAFYHVPGKIHQTVVRTDHNDIVVGKAHITRQFAVEHIVIDIHYGDKAVVAIDLDVTKCTEVVCSSCHIKGMEHGGEG